MEGVGTGMYMAAGARAAVDVSPCTVRVYDNSKKLALFIKKDWILLDKTADNIYSGGEKGIKKDAENFKKNTNCS